MCESCAFMDNVCCTLKTKTLIFAIWTLVHGIAFPIIVAVLLTSDEYINLEDQDDQFALASGITLLIGYLKRVRGLIFFGIILSQFLVWFTYYFIYNVVMQIFFTIWALLKQAN